MKIDKRLLSHFLIFTIISMISSITFAQIEFRQHDVDITFEGASSVTAVDMDDDGDIDIIGTAYVQDEVSWWENDGDQDFTNHVINNNFDGAWFVSTADVDSDDDIDVLAASEDGSELAWWENDGDQNFEVHIIIQDFMGAQSVVAADIDNDDDMDVIGAAKNINTILFFENDGNQNFTDSLVTDSLEDVRSVVTADVDDDGDLDIVGAGGYGGGGVFWWENDEEFGFIEHTVDDTLGRAKSVYVSDIDSDNDIDFVVAVYGNNAVLWYESNGNGTFTGHLVTDSFNGAYSVYAADIDSDDDIDILGAAWEGDSVAVWLNDGNQDFEENLVADEFDGAKSVFAEDMDGDGDIDILAAGRYANTIAWFENTLIGPPSEFSLISPEDGVVPEELPVVFEWHPATTANPEVIIDYSLFLSTDEEFSDPVEFEAGTDTTIEVFDLQNRVDYYWKVYASVEDAGGTWSAETWFFTLMLPLFPPYHFDAVLDEITGEVYLLWEYEEEREDLVESIIYRNDVEFQRTDRLIYHDDMSNMQYGWYEYAVSGRYISGESERSEAELIHWLGTTVDDANNSEIPTEWKVKSVYPNPFNATLTTVIALPQPARLSILIYNLEGQEVATLASGHFQSGYQTVNFNAEGLSSGIYFLRVVVSQNLDEIHKIVLLR
ncbi:MAG: T9SS type A sorting domain-containing protein [Candidatus Electryonea clarkiae]|nr:T9SS type A sorting domain-containing protein [Candidatus Electryonea clarkiae]MDP8288463.1 T9SS type A sorting domain-containing protein [Candidatus Electryonea clarkiae]